MTARGLIIFKSLALAVLIGVVIFRLAGGWAGALERAYAAGASPVVLDRAGQVVAILPNAQGYFAPYAETMSARLKDLAIQKEDRFFYNHPGFNPVSILEAVGGWLGVTGRTGSSTITQQTVKILLGKENQRTVLNKFKELFYSLALELQVPKSEILTMYLNSVYFGNQAQGVVEASQAYFGTPAQLLTDSQIIQLLATLSAPNEANPATAANLPVAKGLAKRLNLDLAPADFVSSAAALSQLKARQRISTDYFELGSLIKPTRSCELTVDSALTQKIREISMRVLGNLAARDARNAAVVVIKLPENELLAIVGSPNPSSFEPGYQVNMALQPRPIGSTVKPFIYVKAFEGGLRPYTLVDDREYKYITALGFPLYPKNFDFKYRGEVTLHYALSNSLNVPAVKVLEFVGTEPFYDFLLTGLKVSPVQDAASYQLGIALGSLELNLFELTRSFTIFPQGGVLEPVKAVQSGNCAFQLSQNFKPSQVVSEPDTELITKILSDRVTGIEQFGFKSSLNLPFTNYALKTGTSRDFRDSWVVGYTPDLAVGVWVGNADASPTQSVSGQQGAGGIWAEVMTWLLNSNYNTKKPFNFDKVKFYTQGNGREFGLAGDNYLKARDILKNLDLDLVLNPHEGDTFLLESGTRLALKARTEVEWFVDGVYLGKGANLDYKPKARGPLVIRARQVSGETVEINVTLR